MNRPVSGSDAAPADRGLVAGRLLGPPDRLGELATPRALVRADEDATWHYYRQLIDLRHEERVFVYGEYDLLPDDASFYADTRTLGGEVRLVVLNCSDLASVFDCAAVDTADATVVVGNGEDPPTDPQGARFGPYEAVVYRL